MNTIIGERIAALICALFAGYMAFKSFTFPVNGNRFPLFSCSVLILISLIMFLRTFITPQAFIKKMNFRVTEEHLRPLILAAITVALVLLMDKVGFYLLAILFFVVTSVAVGIRNYSLIVKTTCIVFPLMYLLFETVLHTGMPRGILP